jgi:hypothetical protein
VLTAVACGTATPTATLSASDGITSESGGHLKNNEALWIDLPVLTVKGKASLRVVSVKFGSYPASGLSQPQFYRVLYATAHSGMAMLEDKYFREYGFKVDGPYRGTTLNPGDPVSFGVAKLTIEMQGSYKISGVIVRYAEPDGSTRTQRFEREYLLTANGGS